MNIKTLHIPCNTQYVRSLNKDGLLEIVNGKTLCNETSIPFEVTFGWLKQNVNNIVFWESFDVAHLHFGFEFESLELVKEVLALIRSKAKAIVYTYHEPCSVHGTPQKSYDEYIKTILNVSCEITTMTSAAKTYLEDSYSKFGVTVIPHGYVSIPDDNNFASVGHKINMPEIILFGALRSNRDIPTTLINLAFAKLGCRITLITRPFSNQQLKDSAVLQTMIASVSQNPLVSIELVLPMTDEEVNRRLSEADILALPYLFGGHSGQIEHAFDCGLLPLITDVGFAHAQSDFWLKDQGVPVVSNWSDGKTWLYQARFIQKAREALLRLSEFKQSINMTSRKTYRVREHESILSSHHEVYTRAIQKMRV